MPNCPLGHRKSRHVQWRDFFAPVCVCNPPFAHQFVAEKTVQRRQGKMVQTYTHLFTELVVLAFEWAAYWETRRQRAVLREWANANGLELLKC